MGGGGGAYGNGGEGARILVFGGKAREIYR
jgi:hypothetical protein